MGIDIHMEVFNKVYRPYLEDDTPTQIFYGGAASGKSRFLAQRCVYDMLRGRNYLCTRKIAGGIRRSNFNEISKVIAEWKMMKLFTINQSDLLITCKATGTQSMFVGMDDPEKIKSITPAVGTLTDIWMEEATENEIDDLKQLEKRLRGESKHRKRVSMSFNPIIQTHWIYGAYFGGWTDSQTQLRTDRLSILKTTYRDNRFLTPDDVDRLLAETDKYYRDVYVDGNWGHLGGAIFDNWRVEDLSESKKNFDNYYNGLDFGFASDPAAFVRVHIDKKRRRIYVTDEFYLKEATNDVLAKEIRKVIGKELVTCDSAEPKSIAELQEYGVSATGANKGKDSVNHGIQWLRQFEIIVDEKCVNMKNELQSYKWQEDKTGMQLPKPVDRFNHLIDALRYSTCREWHLSYEVPVAVSRYDAWEEEEKSVSWMGI